MTRMVRINRDRLWASLMELKQIGAYHDQATGLRGVRRLALTDADAQARRPAKLVVDLVKQRLVALHDPGGDLLVASPGGVLDEGAARLIGGEGRGPANRVVVAAVDPHHLRPFGCDARGGLREHHHRDEHGRPDTEMGRHPGDRAAVVAVGGSH